MFKKGLSKNMERLQKRIQKGEIKRFFVSYKDSAVGRGVISYENGKFVRLLTISNNPRITSTHFITPQQGMNILSKIDEEIYSLQSFVIVPKERNAKRVRKVVLL